MREAVSAWTGAHPYSIDKVLRDMTSRCRDLKLLRTLPEQETKTHAMLMVAVQTMNYLNEGRLRIAPMRRRRILVLVHEDLVPPEFLDGIDEKEIQKWKTEFDVHVAPPQDGARRAPTRRP